MQILIKGKEAAIRKDSTFEFVAENRLFSGSDAFTLSIEFPLRGCPANQEIFGDIHRPEVISGGYVFDCEIRDRHFSRFGSLTITDISDTMAKGQFLEGRAEQNFDKSLDESYINEIDLGEFPSSLTTDHSPLEAWDPATTGFSFVAIPWVNADNGMLHNHAVYSSETEDYTWHEDVHGLTWQPYLLHLARGICDAAGYAHDFAEWEDHPYLSKMLVCNTLPWGWDLKHVNQVLPHWTVPEFFEKLELFLRGEFDFDHRLKKVTFRFTSGILADIAPVLLDKVVDEFCAEVKTKDPDCDFIDARNFAYKDTDHQMSGYYSCGWLIDSTPDDAIIRYPDVASMIDANKQYLRHDVNTGNHRGYGNYGKRFFVENINQWFFIRGAIYKDDNNYHYIFQPLNEFGPRIIDKTSGDFTEIEFVPACVDYTEACYGDCLFVKCGSYSEGNSSSASDPDIPELPKTGLTQFVEAGEKGDAAEYFSHVSVGFYDGRFRKGFLPRPFVSPTVLFYNYQIQEPCYATSLDFSLRINDPASTLWNAMHRIDPTRRYTFKFISDHIPDPRAVFFIGGRRYICEKITATFAESGMSQLLKGEFFPLAD